VNDQVQEVAPGVTGPGEDPDHGEDSDGLSASCRAAVRVHDGGRFLQDVFVRD